MKKLKFKRRVENEEMALQITSMADIFTILLVFLLKSYATGAVDVNPSTGTLLPEAQAGENSVQALKVEVARNAVLIEGQPVATLKEYRFEAADLKANGSSSALSQALERERQRQMLIAKANSDVKVDPKIIIVSDQRAPYVTVKSVLASAALNGYTDFKLAVVKGE
ncbi:MAG: biopolymer transporter ExbD [Oligoflexia bacterium]|nr:biopolymer transporter ExbD [Oligoflexia bacterium]